MSQPTHKPHLEKWLRPGSFLYWQGRSFRLLVGNEADPLTLLVEELVTLERQTFRVEELLLPQGKEAMEPIFALTLEALQAELECRQPASAPLHALALPDQLLKRADAMIGVVETVERLVASEAGRAVLRQGAFRRTPALRQACAQLAEPVKLATYYKYRHLYQKHKGDRGQIAADLRRSAFNQVKMNKTQLHFIDTHILRFYARSRFMRLRPITVYRILQSTLQRTLGLWLDPEQCGAAFPENLVEELLNPKLPMQAILDNPEKTRLLKAVSLPSRSWFYQYLHWFEHQPEQGKDVMIARHGKEMWEREQMVFDTFVARATLPLQYVFADHWLLDIFTVDETTRSQLDRLWLTVLIDAYSRSILGLALLYEAPCIESIQSALRHAIWPKLSHRELGIADEWACYGIPQQLSLDNAWAHHAYSLENLARLIGQGGRYNSIDLVFRPPYKGRYGALIERFFGNLSAQMKELLPGAIRSSDVRGISQAAQEACLLYQDIYRILHQWIVIYQHTPHGELGGLTPHQKWLEGMQWGAPLVPPLTPSLERSFWRMNSETRRITNKGVCAFGLHYWSPELGSAQRVGLDGHSLRYNFSYEPADISRIALFRNEQWVGDLRAKELRRPDGSTLSLSLWEHKMAKALVHSQGQDANDWLGYIGEIDELTQSRLAEKKKVQRTANRQSSASKVPHSATPADMSSISVKSMQPDYTDLLASFVESDVSGLDELGKQKQP